MNDFQSTKKFLIEKVTDYTHQKALDFRATLPSLNPDLLEPVGTFEDYKLSIGNFSQEAFIRCIHNRTVEPFPMWEVINGDEFCFYKPNTSLYYRKDDYVCKLSKTWMDNDWEMFNKTYELNRTLNLIGMEEPIHKEVLYLNYNKYWFTVVKRPNLWNLIEPHSIHHNREYTLDNFKGYVNYIANYVDLMYQLYQTDNFGLPENGALLSLLRVNPDWKVNGVGGVFVDFKHYSYNFTQFLQKTYAGIWDYFTVHPWDPNMSQADRRTMMDYAINLFSTKFNYDRNIVALVESEGMGGIEIS
jgi:hypothetical protein